MHNAFIGFTEYFTVMGHQCSLDEFVIKIQIKYLGFFIPEMIQEIAKV
jgi:hypothetical protein